MQNRVLVIMQKYQTSFHSIVFIKIGVNSFEVQYIEKSINVFRDCYLVVQPKFLL